MKELIVKEAIEQAKIYGIKFPIENIANNLHISKSYIYKYFDSKEELIESIVLKILKELDEQENLIIENHELDDLEKVIQILKIFPKEYNLNIPLMINQIKMYYPKISKKIEKFVGSSSENLKKLFKKMVQENKFEDYFDNELIVKILKNAMKNFLYSDYLIVNSISYDQAVEKIVKTLFYGILKEKNWLKMFFGKLLNKSVVVKC